MDGRGLSARLRLRQIALLARDLDSTVADLCSVFGIDVAYRDPGVALFGLRNAVMPVGDAFLEVVSPVKPDASGARLLAKRGGDCGYMVIVQVGDLAEARERVLSERVRVVFEHAHPAGHTATIHLHPRDTGGALLSLDASDPPGSWDWAGLEWTHHVRTDLVVGLAGATLASDEPAALAARWAAILGPPAAALGGGVFAIALHHGALRFVPAAGGSDGLVGVDLVLAGRAARSRALESAKARGLDADDRGIRIAGTWIRLVEQSGI